MTAFRTLFLTVACLMINQTASACCLFPWFPSFAGYGGWGGYAPPSYASMNYAPSYGYSAPASYASYGGASNCCTQTVGYAGVFSGASASCCVANSCANNCCSTGCSTCGSVGYGSSNCSNCVSTETRKEPVPDPGPAGETRREKMERLERELRELERQEYDDANPLRSDERQPGDDFGVGGSRRGDERDPAGSGGWVPPRTNPNGRGSSETQPFPEYGSGLDGPGSRKPVIGDEDTTGSGVINRGANKPPINVPLEEGTEEDIGKEAGSRDFLPDESADDEDTSGDTSARARRSFLTQRDSRSSHFGVISAKRLARGVQPTKPSRKQPTTKMSSGRKTNAPLQWISVPMPTGRVRS